MKYRRGFTLVEVLVVVAILGTMAVLVFDLLRSFIADAGEAPSELTIEGLVSQARERALIHGKILTLYIDMEKREFGLREYDPLLETSVDASLAQLSERIRRGRNPTTDDKEKKKQEEEKERRTVWLMDKRKLPANLLRIHSVSGLTLAGPDIFLHFYPDGTSDSFILEFEREQNQYLYIPRQNTAPRYLTDLRPAEEVRP